MIKLKKRLIPYYEWLAASFSREKVNTFRGNVAYIFLVANYNNAGDLAISYAQEEFIKKVCPGYTVVSIPVTKTYTYLRSIKQQLKPNDLIFLQGGGSFGDLYPKADYGRLFLCKYFASHQVISFPQTMVFTDTEYGEWRLAKTRKTLVGGKNVTLFARERISLKIMREAFGQDIVHLSPDIVLSLLPSIREDLAASTVSRESVVLTLRADGEKKVSAEQQRDLQNMVQQHYENVVYQDTELTANPPRDVAEGYTRVRGIFDVYRVAKVVVTDRLHGMIFAAVTGTPCIVLPNSNHKISETYKNWLKECNYIKFMDSADADKIKKSIDYFMSDTFKANYQDISIPFTTLEKRLKEATKINENV